jgi:hypothetical protein
MGGVTSPTDARRDAASALPLRWWWGFVPYAIVAVVHVGALAVAADAIAGPTKLLLMPLLAIGVLWGGRGSAWGTPFTLLFMAIALSWLGDGAATFFPGAPEVPTMLACFGASHIAYIVLFTRHLRTRRLPRWSAVYALWWVLLLTVLTPTLLGREGGVLWVLALGAYGLVLGGTALTAAATRPLIAVGAASFLASDSILAFRLFTPEAMPGWTSPLVMLTYGLGQGLIAAGAVIAASARRTDA